MTHANRIGFGVTLALHATAAAVLFSYQPARDALATAVPLMVELITPARLDVAPKPARPVEPPKPRPVARTVPAPVASEPAPVLATPPSAPAPQAAAPVRSEPAAPAAAPVAAQAAEPITPPVFDARYLDNPAPAYPSMSRRLREQGQVLLRVLVNAGGAADAVEIRATSGHERLDDAARDTVRRWRFVPAKRGAEAVPAWVVVPITFRLES